jgi:Lamin Tail Domain
LRKLAIATITTALAVAGLAPGPTTAAEPDQRVGPIRITGVSYDSPGSDTGSNPSLNAEWVAIKNNGSRARQLRGWTLRDPAGHRFRFPRYTLRPGRTVKVHTGHGRRSPRHLYWGQDWYVWNNDGDRATLRNRYGRVIDRCSWGDGDGTATC